MISKIPRIVIAGTSSGCGKTTITCALTAALKSHHNDGIFAVHDGISSHSEIVTFKCGPDYIDPMFHRKLQGVPSANLDLFFSDDDTTIRALFHQHAKDASLAIIEGVMGYYDGMGMDTEQGSTYHLASVLKAPVLLVVNGRGKALSILAEIQGFLRFRPKSRIQGVIINQISPMTYPVIRNQIQEQLGIPVLGYFPKLEVSLESRHLGLTMPEEQPRLLKILKTLEEQAHASIDLNRILQIAQEAEALDYIPLPNEPQVASLRIGIAKDEAFSFYYEDNLLLMKQMGVEWIPFSPLHDRELPEALDGLYLGGGYPELHIAALSANTSMLSSIRQFHKNHQPILAECGGFMYLHRHMEGADGKVYPAAGIINADAYKTSRLQRFGYITVQADTDTALWPKGTEIKAHEFHYWDSQDPGTSCKCIKPSGQRQWRGLHIQEGLLAGFPHLYFRSNPAAARQWLLHCAERKEARVSFNNPI